LAIASALEEAEQLLKEIDVAQYFREFDEAVEAQSKDEVA
jgi:hypothetical protein